MSQVGHFNTLYFLITSLNLSCMVSFLFIFAYRNIIYFILNAIIFIYRNIISLILYRN